MTLISVAINGTPVEDNGWSLTAEEGLRDVSQHNKAIVVVPQKMGQTALETGAQTAPRPVKLGFLIQPTSFTDRATKLDALYAALSGNFTITYVDSPTRQLTGRLIQSQVTSPYKQYVNNPVFVNCDIICDDPLYYDSSSTTLNVTANTFGTVNIGTGDRDRKITISVTTACTNPVIILKDQGGTEVQRMTLTGTIASGHSLTIDCDAKTIVDGTTDVLSYLGATEDFFDFRKVPTITSYSIGCVQSALTVVYYRSWWN